MNILENNTNIKN